MLHLIAADDGNTFSELLKIAISNLGGTAILLYVFKLWLDGRLITRRELDDSDGRHEQMRKERDEWKEAALRLLKATEARQDVAKQAMTVAEKAIEKTGGA